MMMATGGWFDSVFLPISIRVVPFNSRAFVHCLCCQTYPLLAMAICGPAISFPGRDLVGSITSESTSVSKPSEKPLLGLNFPKLKVRLKVAKTKYHIFLNDFNTNPIHLWCIGWLSIALFILV